MKIKEKVKKFTKEHMDEILITVTSAVGAVTIGSIGFVLGQKVAIKDFEKFVKIDLSRDFVYNVREVVLKDVLPDITEVPEALKKARITSLEETVKSAVLAQKR